MRQASDGRGRRPTYYTSILEGLDPAMARARRKVARVDLLGERATAVSIHTASAGSIEYLWPLLKHPHIKHVLRLVELPFSVGLQLRIEAIRASEIRDST